MIKPLWLFIVAGLLLPTANGFSQITQPVAPDSSRLTLPKLPSDDWLGKDKFDHAMISAGLAAAQFYFLRQELDVRTTKSRQIAAGSTLAIGLAKEVYDRVSRRGTPSWKDVLADIVGIGMAAVLVTN